MVERRSPKPEAEGSSPSAPANYETTNTKYRPQFYFRTTDVTGEVELPSGTEMVMPGDDAKFTVKLITPIAMSEKLNFAIREGGKTVGAGVVTKIIK